VDLTTLRLEVRERLGELSADFFSNAEVDRAINEAYRRFCMEEPWSWLLTEWTTSINGSDDELLLPDNVAPNRAMQISVSGGGLGRGYALERLDPRSGFAYRYSRSLATGRPTAYYITRADNDDASTVQWAARIVPAADTDYDVEALYFAAAVDLSGDNEHPLVPEDFQEAIPARAAGKLFLKELDISQKASEQFGIYYEVLQQAREAEQNMGFDETVALGREMPLSRFRSQRDYVMGRIPPNGVGQ
jgi:hypothetical protein